MASENISLSIVMPAYNEGPHIRENLLQASKTFGRFLKRYEIIAVNDGSADNTGEEIQAAANLDSHIKCISYDENKGKGGAVKTGILAADGANIAFLDADLEIAPIHLKDMMKRMKSEDADVVIGSKQHPESKLQYPLSRKVMSLGYYLMLKAMFNLKVHDTQTGVKLYKREVILPIAEGLETNGYAFDIEILAKITMMRFKIVEAPVDINYSRYDTTGRRIGFKDIGKVFKETLAVKKALKHFG